MDNLYIRQLYSIQFRYTAHCCRIAKRTSQIDIETIGRSFSLIESTRDHFHVVATEPFLPSSVSLVLVTVSR